MNPTETEVHAALNEAIERLIEIDHHLLDANASERSLSHRLAIHLIDRFPDYEIDCEYNRDGFDVKKLRLDERVVKDDVLDAVTVFPDIIVHKRGHKNNNLLVIEIKKASSSVSHDYDIEKLKAFKAELNYTFAAHVIIGCLKNSKLVKDVYWQ